MAIPPVKVEFQATGIEEIVELVGQYVLANQQLGDSIDDVVESLKEEEAWQRAISLARKRVEAEERKAAQALKAEERAARDAARALAAASREEEKAAREADRLQAALRAQITGWGTLGTALGQVGAVLGRVSPEMSGFGAVIGQAGQSVQAVASALASREPASIVSALISVSATIADAIGAWRDYSEAQRDAADAAREFAQSRNDVAREIRDRRREIEGQNEATDLDLAGADVRARRDELVRAEVEANRLRSSGSTEEFQRAERERTRAAEALDRARAAQGELVRQDAERVALEAGRAAEAREYARFQEQARRELERQEAILGEAGLAGGNTGGGGASLDSRIAEAQRRADAALRRGLEREQAFLAAFKEQLIERQLAEQEAATEVAQVRADIQRTLNELDASNLERTKANARRRIEILEDEADRTAEVRRTAIERERQLAELNEGGQFIPQSQVDRLLADYDRIEARRQELTQALIAARSVEEADATQRQIRANEREQDAAEFRQSQLERLTEEARAKSEEIEAASAGILQPVLSGITSAIADVISGAASAEEAFQALLSSFLQSIAERAAVEAAAEYAAAIGAFARYDYASGGQHLAAGVAWTGVAVAAGVGAAVTAPAEASATAPADPGGFGGGNGDGGGTVVVNFSGPVVTASTEAELGDNINRLIGQSNARAA